MQDTDQLSFHVSPSFTYSSQQHQLLRRHLIASGEPVEIHPRRQIPSRVISAIPVKGVAARLTQTTDKRRHTLTRQIEQTQLRIPCSARMPATCTRMPGNKYGPCIPKGRTR